MVKKKRETQAKPAPKKRRAKGEGAIFQRGDGLWQFGIDLGKDKTGKRQRKYLYASSRAGLLRKVADETARGGGSIQPRASGTVGEWVERWLQDDVKPNRAANTYAQYESVWRVHAAPLVGRVAFEKLEVAHVERLYAKLRQLGVTSSVIQRVAIVMRRAIEVAIRRRVFYRANPFALIEKPRHRAKEAGVLTAAEARAFLGAVHGTRFEALWVLLLTSGLRLGEALALEWKDLDLGHRTIAVRQGLIEVNGTSRVGPLKTKGSQRQIAIGALASKALIQRKAEAKAEGHGSPFVFATLTGGHPKRSNLRQRFFHPACESVGISGVTIHGLRHSMTSLALAKGLSPKVIAERLGHSTVTLTQDRYQHVLPGMQRKAASAIDGLLDGRKSK